MKRRAFITGLGGADAYRTLEIEVAIALASRNDRIVLETAGGIAGNGPALDVILGAFTTVWLTATPAEHLARVAGQGDSRPMQGNPKAVEHIAALLAQRTPAYARADGVLETSNKTPGQCLAELERMSASVLASRAC